MRFVSAFFFSGDPDNNEKIIRQYAENKQTFDLRGKIEMEGKTRKSRQNAENKLIFLIIVEKCFLYILFTSSISTCKQGD